MLIVCFLSLCQLLKVIYHQSAGQRSVSYARYEGTPSRWTTSCSMHSPGTKCWNLHIFVTPQNYNLMVSSYAMFAQRRQPSDSFGLWCCCYMAGIISLCKLHSNVSG